MPGVDDLAVAVAAAEAGAAVVAAAFGSGGTADSKGTNNPVTDADREAEAAIVALIERHRPGDGILAEEGSGQSGGRRRWIIDPLDGTVNFVHGIPHIAVSVALYEGDRGLAATIIDVMTGERFTARAGGGAHLGGASLSVTRPQSLAGTVVATGFTYDHDRYAWEYTRALAAVLEQVNGIRRFGSAALDLAWVAAGRFDGYWELGVAPWDLAAGALLVREAGGIVTNPWGEQATPDDRLVVAAGPGIQDALRTTVLAQLPEHLERQS